MYVFQLPSTFSNQFTSSHFSLSTVEEKYGKDIKLNPKKRAREDTDDDDDDESSSSSEDEDDNAILATETIDNQIQATIAKIRAKDPSIYDGKTPFYDPIEATAPAPEKEEKPMFLRDYHRENLLSGHTGGEDDEDEEPRTFAQQQEDLKRTVVKEMHAAADVDASDDDDDAFIVRKSKPEPTSAEKSSSKKPTSDLPDPKTADPNNPDDYLQKFLASRAWVKNSSGYVPIESDDSESDAAADDFEYNFNMRFEDPNAAERAKLATYARGTVAEQTVRREEKSRRKKAREEKRKRKEEQKAREEEEKRRLRKLKTEEMMEKVKKIKEAAGLQNLDEEMELEMFHKLMEKDFSDEEWEKWMEERFNEEYYGQEDPMKKPEFDDDIDINDIVPDFSGDEVDEEDDAEAPAEEADEDMPDADDESDEDLAKKPKSKKKTKKDILREKADKKAKDRQLRRKLERFVEDNFDVDEAVGTKKSAFRYRETTPETFGLSALDILAAPDAELNKFAGLKKYAAFRDNEKKERDRKQLSKKKRVKQWRYETFGDGEGVKMPADWKPEGLVKKSDGGDGERKEAVAGEVDIKEGEKKKRRKKKSKTSKA